MGLNAYKTLKPPASGTEGVFDFGDGSEYESRGGLDDFLTFEDTPSAAQIIGFTNETPTTVNFAAALAGTKTGVWTLLNASKEYHYPVMRIPRGKYRYFMVLSSSGAPTTVCRIGCSDGSRGDQSITAMVNPT